MASRLNLQDKLEEILGNENVYFQPPESIKLKYPCIVYSRSLIHTRNADDRVYLKNNRYSVTLITKDPDSDLPDKLLDGFSGIRFDRHFFTNNLIHDVYTLYF